MINSVLRNKYKFLELIGKSSLSEVYLALNLENSKKTAIKKILFSDDQNLSVLRFRREAEALSNISHPYIIKIDELLPEDNGYYIVMEYYDGSDLRRALPLLNLNERIEILVLIADALSYMHGQNIIHRDLKPENILVKSQKEKDIRIVDFGMAYFVDYRDIFKKGSLVGTLAYLSPEQTGLLNREIDNRSDLYSVGVILYEMLTGKQPFIEEDAGRLIHMHLAQTPVEPVKIASDVPPFLNAIAMKLLNKEPNDRYQSAEGLKKDLESYLENPNEKNFTIAVKDKPLNLNYYINLVNNEAELLELRKAYAKTGEGKFRAVIITGEKGTGKSRIIEAFRDTVIIPGSVFLQHRCISKDANTPFAAVKYIIEEYLESIPLKIAKKIIDELGGHEYSLLSKIFKLPENSNKINKLKKFKDNSSQDDAFYLAVIKLFVIISQNNTPFIAFWDDVDIMDNASIDLLGYISQNLKNAGILLILAAKQNEKMNRFVKKIGNNSENTIFIHTLNLEEQWIPEFVAGVLGDRKKFKNELYNEIFNISLGNPLLIFEILKFFYEKGIIKKENGQWSIDYQSIHETELKNNILETLLDRLEKFSDEEILILSYAAVIGHDFTFEFLIKLAYNNKYDFLIDDMINVIDRAEFERLIEKSKSGTRKSYKFVHDGLVDALINKLDIESINRLNTICAEILELEHVNNIDNVLFLIAHYYNQTDKEDKKLYYNELAYKKSYNSYSLKEAVYYLKKAVDYLVISEKVNEDTLEKTLALASYMQLVGKINESFHYVDISLSIANNLKNPVKQVQAKLTYGIGYLYLSDTGKASTQFIEAISLAEKHNIEIKQGAPYRLAGSACWFSSQFEEAKRYYTKAIEYLPNDDYENLAPAFGLRAWCHIMTGNIKKAMADINTLETLINHLENSLLLPYSFHHAAIIFAYLNNEEKALEYSEKTFEYGKKMNNIIAIFSSFLSRSYIYLFQNDYSSAIKTINTAIEYSENNRTYLGIDYFYGNLAEAYLWNKEYEKALSIVQKHFHNPNLNKYPLCQLISVQAVFSYLKNDYCSALNKLDEAVQIYESNNLVLPNAFNFYFRWKLLEKLNNKKESKKAENLFKRLYVKNSDLKFLARRAEALFRSFKDSSYTFSSVTSSSVKDAIQLENIIQTSQALLSIREIDDLLKSIMLKTLEVTGASRGALLLYNDEKMLESAAVLDFQNSTDYFDIPDTIIQEAEKTKKAIVLTDLSGAMSKNLSESVVASHIKSILVLPIIMKEELVGILYLDSMLINGLFTEEHVRLLNVFTAQAAIAIDNARAYKELKKEKDMLDERVRVRTKELFDAKNELEKLNDITVYLSKSLDIDIVFERIVNYLRTIYDFEGYVLYLCDRKAGKYHIEACRFPEEMKRHQDAIKGMEFPLENNNGLVNQCLLNDKFFYRSDIDPLEFEEPINSRVITRLNIKSILNIPVHLESEIIGLFSLTGHTKNVYLNENDIQAIGRFVNQISVIVRNSKLYEEIQNTKTMLEQKDKILSFDLSMAKKIQTGYLHCDFENMPELEIALHFQPMIEVGGDIFDVYKLKENYYRILIADATGHGIQAALITMVIKSEYDKIKFFDLSTDTIIKIFNTAFMDYYSHLNMYFSCALVDIDLEKKVLYYSSAGHPDQYLVSKENVMVLQTGGTILGISDKSEYQMKEVDFPDDSKIILFTDGLFEEFDNPDNKNREDALKKIIEENVELRTGELMEKIITDVTDWRKQNPAEDDITLLVISAKK